MGLGTILGVIKSVITVGAGVAKLFSGGKKPSVAEVLPHAVTLLLPAVKNAVDYGGMDTKDKFESWLTTADAHTGSDVGAIDLIPSLPADKEEELFDHLIAIARIYGYMLLKVEGYVEPTE